MNSASSALYNVLIVDDLDVNRLLVKNALKSEIFHVSEAIDGEQALRCIQMNQYDVVLLDIMMPGIDGAEVCRIVRKELHDDLLPIIMVTAMDDPEGIGIAFQAGANDYISKPFSKYELSSRVKSFAERRRIEKELIKRKEYIDAVMANMRDGIITIDEHGLIDSFNPAAEQMFGFSQQAIIGEHIKSLFTISSHQQYQDHIASLTLLDSESKAEVMPLVLEGLRKDGSIFPLDLLLSEMKIGDKRLMIGNIRDTTRRKQNEERMLYLANFDDLTGLPNRNLFQDRLQHAVERAQRAKQYVALFYIDLDDFKRINDTMGHKIGDQLVQSVAERLSDCVRKSDTVARIGGDEFAVVLEGVDDTNSATQTADKIIEVMNRSIMLDNNEVYVTCSIGIVLYPTDTVNAQEMLKDADAAMYRAKGLGKNRYQYYTPDMNTRSLEQLLLETSLRRALYNEEFMLHYQPQMDVGSGRIVAMEALLRWQHPERGMLPPIEFITLLEETGLIIPIGEYVLRTACAQNANWQQQGMEPRVVSVNLSAKQFDDPGLINKIELILEETGLDPEYLELEITESSIMRDVESCVEKFRILDRMGISIAIDDFGTGYSSLSYLRQFPVDTLKIDRSFVIDATRSDDGLAIPKAIIGMAQALNMKVVAEGVETDEQLELFTREQCHSIQGYFFSKPLPVDQMTDLLLKYSVKSGIDK